MSGSTAPRLLLAVHSARLQGAQLATLGQARSLAGDCELVTAVGDGPLRAELAALGAVIGPSARLPIWGAPAWRWAVDGARSALDVVRLARVARGLRIDAIVAGSTVLAAPVLAARLAGIPVVVCAHEAPASAAARRLLRFHGTFADTVIAISPWIAESLAGARARVVTCAVGIPLPPWTDGPAPAARSGRGPGSGPAPWPGGPGSRPLALLTVGTIDAHKRPDVAVAALGRLRDGGLDATLQIVGGVGDVACAARLREQVRSLALDDRVALAGERRDVLDRMRSADVLLVPAGEVTPLVMMEAMAVGTPVVAARMGGIPEVVVDGESGLLVAPGDPAAMADAVLRLRDEPGLRERLRISARRRVEQRFDQRRFNLALRDELARLGVRC